MKAAWRWCCLEASSPVSHMPFPVTAKSLQSTLRSWRSQATAAARSAADTGRPAWCTAQGEASIEDKPLKSQVPQSLHPMSSRSARALGSLLRHPGTWPHAHREIQPSAPLQSLKKRYRMLFAKDSIRFRLRFWMEGRRQQRRQVR